MSTSGTYTFTVTRDDIIREAMLNLGKIGAVDPIDPTETADCARKLNMLVKQWMGRQDFAPGLKMWTRIRGDLFLSQSQGVYTLSPTGDNWAFSVAAPLNKNTPNYNQAQLNASANAGATSLSVGTTAIAGITQGDFVVVQLNSGDIYSGVVGVVNSGAGTFAISPNLTGAASSSNFVWNYTTKGQPPLELHTVILRDTNYVDTPVDYMTLETYEALPTKAQPGFYSDPTSVYYETQLISGVRSGHLFTDCAGAQDVTKRLHIVGLRAVQDFNNPADNPDYPQEWFMALAWGLSKVSAPMFNAVWTQEMEGNFKDALASAREANPERTDFYFQPNAGSPNSP